MKIGADFFYTLVFVLCIVIITGSLLFLRPFWGLMDDASLAYKLIPQLDQGGVFLESWRYSVSDVSWGMFRPIYPLMAYIIYKPGLAFAPWVSFGINGFFSILLLWGMARFWAVQFKMNWREVLLINSCFYYQYDLLWHPSLQEKIVILAGVVLLTSTAWCPRRFLFPVFEVLALIGFLTKASFAIYFGAAFFVLIGRVSDEIKSKRATAFYGLAFAASVGLLAVLALGNIANHGSYTKAHYNIANIWPNLASAHAIIFLSLVLLGAVMFCRTYRTLLRSPEVFAPWVGLVLFLLIFLPWSISGYIQTVIGPVISVLVCQIVYFFLPRSVWRQGFFGLACILAVAICSFRVCTMFLRLHDLGEIVKSARAFASEPLNMPCAEGAGSMRILLRTHGFPQAEVKFQSALPADIGGVWLYDGRMCPLPQPVLNTPDCVAKYLYRPFWSGSYRVVRLRCKAIEGA